MNVIDFHCDTISRLMEEGAGTLQRNALSVDIEKLKLGGSLAQFFALYINAHEVSDPLEAGLAMLDRFYAEMAANPDDIAPARNYDEMMANQAVGKISAFLTIEEGGVLKGQLHHLRNFYRLGVRLITLTWNYPNELGFPHCVKEYQTRGLTPAGIAFVEEMNRLGMLVDVSHLSDQGFYDVARTSRQPFIASHSNARSVKNHTRNLTDDMIRVLAEKGGVMGINFEKSFLGSAPISRVEDMVRHIQHILKVGGSDVLALGTDFDGISPELELADFSQMNKLQQALEAAGLSAEQQEKIFCKNAKRIIRDVLR